MEKIISVEKGLEFICSPEFDKSFFEVLVVSLGSSKRKTLKFPFGISEPEINAKLSQAVAPSAANVAPLSADIALEHCGLYKKNIYCLYTLLHDNGIRSFVAWLQEWYIRNFLASLIVLAAESPAFAVGSQQEQPEQTPGGGIVFTVARMLSRIGALADNSFSDNSFSSQGLI
jgi:hypothetical protein